MAKKKQETKNNKKEKKEVVVKEEKVVKEVPKKESKKESKKDTKKVNKVNDDKVFKMLEFFDKYRLAIYGAVGGILITVLVVVIIWPDRIATLKDGTQPVAEIDGYTVTANDLYEDMKDVYSISSLLDKIDNKILEEKYPETDEMNDELKQQAELEKKNKNLEERLYHLEQHKENLDLVTQKESIDNDRLQSIENTLKTMLNPKEGDIVVLGVIPYQYQLGTWIQQ